MALALKARCCVLANSVGLPGTSFGFADHLWRTTFVPGPELLRRPFTTALERVDPYADAPASRPVQRIDVITSCGLSRRY